MKKILMFFSQEIYPLILIAAMLFCEYKILSVKSFTEARLFIVVAIVASCNLAVRAFDK